MARKYYTLDVFTDDVLTGNPLAVVLDCEGLDGVMMQRIAAEFNLSETVFVLPPEDQNHMASIRIFVPKRELPFAGHPTVGTAVLLSQLNHLAQGAELVLEEKVGPVSCIVSGNQAQFTLPQLPIRTEVGHDASMMALALGLNETDLGIDGHSYAVCDAGLDFPMFPISGLKAMQDMELNPSRLTEHQTKFGLQDKIVVYTKECVNAGSHYHMRMFSPAFGIPEDPATGSAAAGLAAQIMACDKPEEGEHNFIIEQGFEMGRPSIIELGMNVKDGVLVSGTIGGSAVIVSEGILKI